MNYVLAKIMSYEHITIITHKLYASSYVKIITCKLYSSSIAQLYVKKNIASWRNMMKEKQNFILPKSSKEPSSPYSSTFLHY